MPKKILQIKAGDTWHTLGRVTEEGAQKYVALTTAGTKALEANPIDDERVCCQGKTLTVSASYMRNNAETCRVVMEADAESAETQQTAKAEAEPAKKPAKKKSKKKAAKKSGGKKKDKAAAGNE